MCGRCTVVTEEHGRDRARVIAAVMEATEQELELVGAALELAPPFLADAKAELQHRRQTLHDLADVLRDLLRFHRRTARACRFVGQPPEAARHAELADIMRRGKVARVPKDKAALDLVLAYITPLPAVCPGADCACRRYLDFPVRGAV